MFMNKDEFLTNIKQTQNLKLSYVNFI